MKLFIVLCLIFNFSIALTSNTNVRSKINMSNEIKSKLDYLHYINQQNIKNDESLYAFKEKDDKKKEDEKEPELLEN